MDIFLIDDSPQSDFLLSEWNNHFHIGIDWIDKTAFLLLCYDITENRVLLLFNHCAFLQFLFADARIAYPITVWRGYSSITMRSYVALKIGIPACYTRGEKYNGNCILFIAKHRSPRLLFRGKRVRETARRCVRARMHRFDGLRSTGKYRTKRGMHRNAILKHAEFHRGVHARSVRRDAKMR